MTLYPLEHPRTQSSLLVPNRFQSDFEERTKGTSREIYFHFLIKRYGFLILSGALGRRDTIKRRFQNPGRDLVQRNFRPVNHDWAQFDALSDYLVFSKTGLFTLLLVLDIAGWDVLLAEKLYDLGVPPTIAGFSARILLINQFPPEIYRKISYRIRR